jgi:hypothetical protein
LQFAQDYGVYGNGMEKKPYELGDEWLLPGMERTTWIEYVKNYGPWELR